jgi:hypothetical protein
MKKKKQKTQKLFFQKINKPLARLLKKQKDLRLRLLKSEKEVGTLLLINNSDKLLEMQNLSRASHE